MTDLPTEKLTGLQLVGKFPAFYGNGRLLAHSHMPNTCPCPGTDPSSPCLPIPLLEDPF